MHNLILDIGNLFTIILIFESIISKNYYLEGKYSGKRINKKYSLTIHRTKFLPFYFSGTPNSLQQIQMALLCVAFSGSLHTSANNCFPGITSITLSPPNRGKIVVNILSANCRLSRKWLFTKRNYQRDIGFQKFASC